MITKTELNDLWSAITPQLGQNVGRRADPEHPLDFFVAYDEKPNMQFILLTEFEPALPNSSKQLFVRGNRRADGKYAVCFSLEDDRLKDQYVSLCWDIMDSTYSCQSKKSGVQAAIKRFTMWQKLFAEAKSKKLSDAEIKGLIGELVILKDVCVKKYGVETAVSGWLGPAGADRDFEFDDTWYESKFVSLSMDKVKISSIDQLDIEREGYLILCRAEKTAATTNDHITLNKLVNNIIEMAQADENTVVSLKNRLALAGYDASDERAEQPYIIHHLEGYKVFGTDFPRIVRSKIHAAISEGEYQLSIPALQPWGTEIN